MGSTTDRTDLSPSATGLRVGALHGLIYPLLNVTKVLKNERLSARYIAFFDSLEDLLVIPDGAHVGRPWKKLAARPAIDHHKEVQQLE